VPVEENVRLNLLPERSRVFDGSSDPIVVLDVLRVRVDIRVESSCKGEEHIVATALATYASKLGLDSFCGSFTERSNCGHTGPILAETRYAFPGELAQGCIVHFWTQSLRARLVALYILC